MSARAIFEQFEGRVDQRKLAGIEHSYLFDVEGEGVWLVVVHDGAVAVTEGEAPADVTITVSSEAFDQIANGRENPAMAYAMGRLTIRGDMRAAETLQNLF